MTVVTVNSSPLPALRVDTVVLGVAPGRRGPVPAAGAEVVVGAFDGALADLLDRLGMTGDEGEAVKLPAPPGLGAGLVLAVGLGAAGEDGEYDAEALRRAAGVAARALVGTGRAALALPVGTPEAAAAVALGGLLGAYAFTIGEKSGGALTAGLFLREFVPAGTAWAHLDIAGPAYHEGEPYGYTPHGGTGAAVRTLVRLAEEIALAGA